MKIDRSPLQQFACPDGVQGLQAGGVGFLGFGRIRLSGQSSRPKIHDGRIPDNNVFRYCRRTRKDSHARWKDIHHRFLDVCSLGWGSLRFGPYW
jgi:hypothetical protein